MWTYDRSASNDGLQRVSTANSIKREDADECREHVKDVVQTADPSVQKLCMLVRVSLV